MNPFPPRQALEKIFAQALPAQDNDGLKEKINRLTSNFKNAVKQDQVREPGDISRFPRCPLFSFECNAECISLLSFSLARGAQSSFPIARTALFQGVKNDQEVAGNHLLFTHPPAEFFPI
jgi:hypothetical protein